jgi:hypothetical protein
VLQQAGDSSIAHSNSSKAVLSQPTCSPHLQSATRMVCHKSQACELDQTWSISHAVVLLAVPL